MIRTEFGKVFRFLPMWVYLALCLMANTIIAFNTDETEPFNRVSSVTGITGQNLSEEFFEKLEEVPEGEGKEEVIFLAEQAKPLYENYDVASKLTSFYTETVSASPLAVRIMEKKYEPLQKTVDRLAESGADMDLYAGAVTTRSHQNLFSTLLRTMGGEVCILAMLLTVYLLGYEKMMRTEQYFLGTRTGRKMFFYKVLVSLISSVLIYVVLAGLSLAIYFAHWDFSGMWDARVSSQFNTVKDLLMQKPFITVADFTVKEYLFAALGLSLVLVVVAVLFAAVVGLLVRNTYVAGLGVLLLPVLCRFVTTMLAGTKLWTAYLISMFQPVNIWLAEPVWFTEGGINAPCLWFEVKGMAFSLVLFAALAAIALKVLQRRDVI